MQDKIKVALVGYSGHGFVVFDAAKLMGLNVVSYCDRIANDKNPLELEYLGDEGTESFVWQPFTNYVLGIGDNNIRKKVADSILSNEQKIETVIHPKAIISKFARISKGTFINSSVSINAFATIGEICIINTGAIVEHECKIGNAVHIAPGAVLAGNVSIGDLTFIGANSVIKQGIKVGKNCIIGAGAVVITDIPDNSTVVGNPAKKIK